MKIHYRVLLLLGQGLLALAGVVPAWACAASADCLVGSYRLEDGTALDVALSASPNLRWRKFDGTTGVLHPQADGTWLGTAGWTDRSDGIVAAFDACGVPDLNIRFGPWRGRREAYEVHEVSFDSHGVSLVGRLVMPPGHEKVPVVVLVHGSEPDSALETYSLQRMLPAQGVGAFVYDKRGTGRSGGTYTQDYSVLADDAVAALATARSLGGTRAGRMGYQGGSQGGWVVPLAAARTHADFLIVCFGLAVSAVEEDQEAVAFQLHERGYSATQIRAAQRVARAAERVMESGMSAGFQEFDQLRSRYAKAPWYKDLRGDYTWILLPKSEAELRAMAKDFDWHTPWHYESMPVLRASRTPQLWILGGEDEDAPSGETRRRILDLIKAGADITLAYYPKAEHGMTYFEVNAEGERLSTRYAPGYFQMLQDYAKQGAIHDVGDAEVTRPRPRH
jgi:dienelactone hydrolase